MSPNQPTEHPNDRGGPRTYILPHRIHRILDTTAQVADALRGIVRNQEPAAIRVHSVSALVWLFRVRRAFGRYWHPKLPWEGSRKLRYHSHRLYQFVKRCHDSALMRMVKTAPFRDMQTGQSPADETHRCNPALFEDWRYRALTDKDLTYITEEIRGYADGIRKRVSILRNALWEELDREQGIPQSPTMKDADEVDAFFRPDRQHNDRAWRKMVRRSTMTSEANSKWRDGPADAPVRLNGPDEKMILWGKPKPPLPPAQYAVVKVLLEAYRTNERLSKTQLEKREGRARELD